LPVEVAGRTGVLRVEYALNLSASGMGLHMPQALPLGETLRLAFRLPDGGGAIEARARVVWSEAAARTARPRFREIGVRFEVLAEADRRRLLAFLDAGPAR
jgi:c-di-GMP-binding flagellar brake protein YcgR